MIINDFKLKQLSFRSVLTKANKSCHLNVRFFIPSEPLLLLMGNNG
ncbi:hypothetical protein CRENPOLYSF2_3440002 [Crenothrix polyspora]|uniref:Uncharacterized protein n=1 Tax=Crenothrix polyspora TaxID=360316 RepID=A0A1R4HBR6_9GAMM|nr:hypothetical protein CRENPOLYSF2_3440002 [Crenothrix polyspora]